MQGAPDLTVTLTKQPQIYLLVGEVGFVKHPHSHIDASIKPAFCFTLYIGEEEDVKNGED
jgi:hypothetical protein